MIRSPLPVAIFYLFIGCLFIFWAVTDVRNAGEWTLLSIFCAIFATFDIYTAIRYIKLHFKIKKMNQK
ncbi:hypothetical protein [Terribacillus sp. 7520-G]|uniref:hypothetical protein n=1 Tax=Terribacillus TaxID=459532 RepID=UPI000BA52F4D|nr:hypothetical protein [Terribacillus sp. 7520-G]PAD37723.1 hypothetical protein CHH53_14495 [Terribacillus sp. 7520-G]